MDANQTNATNSTANYGLPKFIATDKPSWLVDWNNTMDALDSLIKKVADAGDNTQIQEELDNLTTIVNGINTRLTSAEGDIDDLEDIVSNATTGLVKKVSDIQADLLTQNSLIQNLDARVTALEKA